MNTLIRLFGMWVGYRRWIGISLLLTIGGALCTLAVPALSQSLINEGIIGNDLGMILQYGGYMLLFTLVAAGLQVVNTLIAVNFSEWTAHHLRVEAYNRIQQFSFGNLDRLRPSDLLMRLTNDIQNIKIAIQQGILNLALVPVSRFRVPAQIRISAWFPVHAALYTRCAILARGITVHIPEPCGACRPWRFSNSGYLASQNAVRGPFGLGGIPDLRFLMVGR